MNQITCPKCGTAINLDESDYEGIVRQVRDDQFAHEVEERAASLRREHEQALELARSQAKAELDRVIAAQVRRAHPGVAAERGAHMNQITCPKCGTAINLDESDYEGIVRQVRDDQFAHEVEERAASLRREHEQALELARSQAKAELDRVIAAQKAELQEALSRSSAELQAVKARSASELQEARAASAAALQQAQSALQEARAASAAALQQAQSAGAAQLAKEQSERTASLPGPLSSQRSRASVRPSSCASAPRRMPASPSFPPSSSPLLRSASRR